MIFGGGPDGGGGVLVSPFFFGRGGTGIGGVATVIFFLGAGVTAPVGDVPPV